MVYIEKPFCTNKKCIYNTFGEEVGSNNGGYYRGDGTCCRLDDTPPCKESERIGKNRDLNE